MKSVAELPGRSTIACCVVLLSSILRTGSGLANIYNVTNTADGPALNQLRGAILNADSLGGTHTINVAAGTYTLTLGEITFGNTAQNITIIGTSGPSSTIISMTSGAGKDRIFFINPSGTTNSPVIAIQGIKFQNGFLTSDLFGGAAICAGGGSAESLTITNCIFDNNVLPANAYGGAAVNMQVRGNLTIDNSTFTNNVSNDADGGAVLFIIFNTGLGTSFGTLSVTNSTFTGNSVVFPGPGTSNGGALAFTGQAGVTPFNATITNNTFIGNTADGLGGAIVANNSPNLSIPQIHFNRFFNNTSAASPLSSGLHFVESSGSVNAENNWWGCNTNPVSGASTAPCNQAGGDVAGGGSLDANPWLQLKVTASPNLICNVGPSNTSTVTASVLNNSDGTAIPLANLSRLIGVTVTWPVPTLGSLSSQQTTIQANGTATALFTSNGTGGTATVNAQVDSVPAGEASPARASITVTSVTLTSAPGTDAQTVPVNTAITSIAYATSGATGATFSGLPPGVSGSWAANVATISGTPTTAAGSPFNYTVTPTGGCGGVVANGSVTVNKGNTAASITSQTLATTLPGESFSVSFNAAPSNTSNAPTAMTGNVIVSDGTDSCSGAINGSGNGSCSITLNTLGARTLTATYQGDGNFNASVASPGLGHSVTNTATWIGTSSTNWSTAGNWNTQLAPGSSNDADIPTGVVPFEPAIGAVAVNVANLTVGAGHTLTVNVGGSLASTGTATINGNLGGSGGVFTFNNLIIDSAGGVTLTGNATVNGLLTLTNGVLGTGANTLAMAAGATRTRASGYVIGNERKTFGGVGSFTFDVGTANGYSPVIADATAGTFPSDLTINATQGAHPSVNAPTAIQRYWTLAGSNLTANLTFQYLAGDVMGTEANYKVIRISGGVPVSFPSSTVNTGLHQATLNGVSSFSDWTVGEVIVPVELERFEVD